MKRQQTHIKYGFVIGLIIVVLSLIFHVMDMTTEGWTQWFVYAVFFIGLIMNAFAYSKANDHYVTFGNVFSSCFKATAIITIVSLAWALLSFVIFPDMKEEAMEIARQSMADNPNMSEDQIDQSLEMTDKYFVPFMIGGIIFSYMFFGAIFSLIAAIFPKKKASGNPQVQQ